LAVAGARCLVEAVMQRDLYQVPGVGPNASPAEIQEAYHRLARAYHPDVSGADTAAKFREVQEAYEILADADRRRDYHRQTESRGQPSRWTHSPGPRTSGAAEPVRPGRAGREENWARQGVESDLHLEFHMSPAEAARGGDVALELPVVERCPHCGGWGYRSVFLCRACGGTGHGVFSERFTLHVPPGLADGAVVRVDLHPLGILPDRLVIHVRVG
jgi:molecular chaperone DnaJ